MDKGLTGMTVIDLDTLSLRDLKSLQKDLAKAVATYEDRQKAEARAKVEALAKELGFSLANLINIEEVKTTRAAATAKYRHPENAELTWSGRGRKPLWFIAAIDAGKSPEDLAV